MNYYYNDNEELTGYDKFMLSKKTAQRERDVTFLTSDMEKSKRSRTKPHRSPKRTVMAENRQYSDYDKYLFSHLSRTEPSAERVLTQEEFYGGCVEKGQAHQRAWGKMFNNVTFKKWGKLILAFYVIIVMVLASILIVANTSNIYKSDIANATQNSVTESKGVVSSMTIEDNESQQDNWFDRLCDAINK